MRSSPDVRAALAEHTPVLAVRDVLDELVAHPTELQEALGPVEVGGITTLHNAADLTVLHVAWTPGNWSSIPTSTGCGRPSACTGARRTMRSSDELQRVSSQWGAELPAGDVLVLGNDAIHSVANSRREFAVALHVYGGDFFTVERSEWDFETHEERPRDFERTARLFEEANTRWFRQQP